MPVRRFPGLSLALVALSVAPLWGAPPQSLDKLLTPYLQEFGLPAIAAAVFQNGSIVASGAVGTRRAGTLTPVTVNDRFHIGSDSKAFTALLAGQFVQQNKLRWDATPADVFPELKPEMNAEPRSTQTCFSPTSGAGRTMTRGNPAGIKCQSHPAHKIHFAGRI